VWIANSVVDCKSCARSRLVETSASFEGHPEVTVLNGVYPLSSG
jgi:hypothetical protein